MTERKADKFTDLLDSDSVAASESNDRAEDELQLAAAILMFEVVKADLKIDRSEMSELMSILRTQFKLDDNGLGSILELAGDAGNDGLDLQSLTTSIREKWGSARRLELLKNFWVIAVADKDIDDRETDLIERIAGLLQLQAEQIADAKTKAENMLTASASE